MENQLCFLTIFVSLLWIILIEAWKRSNSKDTSRNLPPGPWKLPIIGNMHQLVGVLPHHRLADLAKKYGPIMHLQLGQVSNIVISSAELAEEVLKTHDLIFASRPSLLAASVILYGRIDIAMSPYGKYWSRMRKICSTEVLSSKRVQSFRSIWEEEVSHLIRSISLNENLAVNLTKMVMALTRCITSRTTFGMVREQEDDFTPVVQKIVDVFGAFNVDDLFPSVKLLQVITGTGSKLQKVHEEADAILEDIIREHTERNESEKNESNDLVDVLLNFHDHDRVDFPLSTQDIKAVILDVLVGGIETTSRTIEWAMSETMKHPKVLERAQVEVRQVFHGKDQVDETLLPNLPYLNAVIKETLRLHPPLPLLIPREAREGVELCGYAIPKKTRVMINAHAIGRDPKYWEKPGSFCPERFLNSSIDFKGTNFQFIPFGAGRRICPGITFGMSMVQFVLANLLYQLDWKMPNEIKPEDLDMSENSRSIVGRKNDLFLVPKQYIPLQVNKI